MLCTIIQLLPDLPNFAGRLPQRARRRTMNRKQQASILRTTRQIHRKAGIFLFIIILAIAVTGLLLGWKKNVSSLQYPTQRGQASEVSAWLPMDSIITIANRELMTRLGAEYATEIDKLDARPDKGIVKVIYANHYYSFQVDAATGDILSLEYRTSDLVEHLHDGTWVDKNLNLPGGIFKLIYTSVAGLALLTFTVSGLWLFIGPKVLRNTR